MGLRDRAASRERPYELAVTARITGTRCSIDAVLVSLFISLFVPVLLPALCDCSEGSIGAAQGTAVTERSERSGQRFPTTAQLGLLLVVDRRAPAIAPALGLVEVAPFALGR